MARNDQRQPASWPPCDEDHRDTRIAELEEWVGREERINFAVRAMHQHLAPPEDWPAERQVMCFRAMWAAIDELLATRARWGGDGDHAMVLDRCPTKRSRPTKA